jgi:hypothetical protein
VLTKLDVREDASLIAEAEASPSACRCSSSSMSHEGLDAAPTSAG